jgi:hypothetical protein
MVWRLPTDHVKSGINDEEQGTYAPSHTPKTPETQTKAVKHQPEASHVPPNLKQLAPDAAMRETEDPDEQGLMRAMKGPCYLELHGQTTDLFTRLDQLTMNCTTADEMRTTTHTLTYLNWFICTHTDPREALTAPIDWDQWLEFLADTQIPVFPWEHGIYLQIAKALDRIGVQFKGDLQELVRAKKSGLHLAKSNGLGFTPIPLSLLTINDDDLAVKWIKLPNQEGAVKELDDALADMSNGASSKVAHSKARLILLLLILHTDTTQHKTRVHSEGQAVQHRDR